MNKVIKNMKVEDMSIGMAIIIVGDFLVEVHSLEVGTTYHDYQFNVSHVTIKIIDMHTFRTKTRPT